MISLLCAVAVVVVLSFIFSFAEKYFLQGKRISKIDRYLCEKGGGKNNATI